MTPSVREQLEALNAECEALCAEVGWTGMATDNPNFRLLYSSVESYEGGSGIAIIGMNPAGGREVADSDDRNRPFREASYSAYLNDRWNDRRSKVLQGVGQDNLQKEIQSLAMILCGSSTAEAMKAKDTKGGLYERISREAIDLLYASPSGNIIPFRSSKLEQLPHNLRAKGEDIGWKLLCLAKPHTIITLINGPDRIPWRTIITKSDQRKKIDYEVWVDKNLRRKYREVRLVNGPLSGTLVIGLPAVVYHRGDNNELSAKMFEVLAKRVHHHGLVRQ